MSGVIQRLKEAGIFERYGVEVSQGNGVYMQTDNGEVRITKDNVDAMFGLSPKFFESPNLLDSLFYIQKTPCSFDVDALAENEAA